MKSSGKVKEIFCYGNMKFLSLQTHQQFGFKMMRRFSNEARTSYLVRSMGS
jgi:hypothetical protein